MSVLGAFLRPLLQANDAGFLAGGLPLRYGSARSRQFISDGHGWPSAAGAWMRRSGRFAPDAAPVRATRRWGTPVVGRTGGTPRGTPMAMDGQVPREPWMAGAAPAASLMRLTDSSSTRRVPTNAAQESARRREVPRAETVSVEPAETSGFLRGKTLSGRWMSIEHWEMNAERVCWVEPGSRAVGCERGAPLRRSVTMAGVPATESR